MKKFFYSMMACVLAFSSVACSDDDDPTDGGNGGATPAEPASVLYSFTQKAYVLGLSTDLTVELLDAQANALVADENIPVNLVVDAEASTAVEGEDFEVVAKEAVVAKGSNKCTFTVKSIVKEDTPAEDDEDDLEGGAAEVKAPKTIVVSLQIANSEKYTFTGGAAPKATLTITPTVADLYGTWVMNELVTDAKTMEDLNYGYATFSPGFPVCDDKDKFVFEDGKLTTDLSSDWKNYFRPTANFTIEGEVEAVLDNNWPQTKALVQLIKLDNVNRYFSADEESAEKTALVGIRNITTEEGETLLDVYVLDYEPHMFAPEIFEWIQYEETRPQANVGGCVLNFTLKKAK